MIYLTGMPRCGATRAGQTLAHLTGSRYVHEPLNGHRHPDWVDFNMRYYRPGACDPTLLQILRSSARSADRRVRWSELLKRRQSVVVKEVHGTLAVECVHRHLRADIVIVTRHPCGVAASWKRLGWLLAEWSRRDRLLTQEALVEDHLAPFRSHILSSREPYFRLGAYWGAIHHVLHRLASSHPRWQWVTHEELCSSPADRFAALLQALGRTAQPGSRSLFEARDDSLARTEAPFDLPRDTAAQSEHWRTRLSAGEIGSVLTGAAPFGVEKLLRIPVRVEAAPPANALEQAAAAPRH